MFTQISEGSPQSRSVMHGLPATHAPAVHVCPAEHVAPSSTCPLQSSSTPLHVSALGVHELPPPAPLLPPPAPEPPPAPPLAVQTWFTHVSEVAQSASAA